MRLEFLGSAQILTTLLRLEVEPEPSLRKDALILLLAVKWFLLLDSGSFSSELYFSISF